MDWTLFFNEVEDNIAQITSCQTMKEKVEKFRHVLIQAAKKHVGKIRAGGRRKSCITPPVRAAIKRRNRLRKDMRNNQAEWKESAKEVRELKRKAREQA